MKKIQPHGKEWEQACRDLGMPIHYITRCHDYIVAQSPRKSTPVECSYCYTKKYVSLIKAKQMKNEKYNHKKCIGYFKPLN